MPRKLPNGAYCGEPLKDTDHMLRQFSDITGKPEVGWHAREAGDCFDEDPIRPRLAAASKTALIMHLRQIENRGEGRLVANKGWLKVVTHQP